MVVRHDGRRRRVYYQCSKYAQPWAPSPCDYRKLVPGTWDDQIWDDICSWLRNETWIEQQLTSEEAQSNNSSKLIRIQKIKISRAGNKLAKVREGFEGGIYSLDEAKARITDIQATIQNAQIEIERLQESQVAPTVGSFDLESVRKQLGRIRDKNLDKATFEEKLEITAKLGIKVHPSEDPKSMRVTCELDLRRMETNIQYENFSASKIPSDGERELECEIVMHGHPCK